jgi:hypothetical protein
MPLPVGLAALSALASVQLRAPGGGMCLASSARALAFVPCALAGSWTIEPGGRLADARGSCVVLARDGSAALAAGCAPGRGERLAEYKAASIGFGWGRCLARAGNAVAVVKGDCARVEASPLWSVALHFEGVDGRAPGLVFAANPQLLAYLCCVFVTLAVVLAAQACVAPPAGAQRAARAAADGGRAPVVAMRCEATTSSSAPVRLTLHPAT